MAPAGGQGGRGTQTASLNQQHFLNIFNVKTNRQRENLGPQESRGSAAAPCEAPLWIAVTVSARGTVAFILAIICGLKR